MLHIHFGALHSVDHQIGSGVRAMTALCRSPKPVILIRGHEHELAAPTPGYLYWLAPRFVLKQGRTRAGTQERSRWAWQPPRQTGIHLNIQCVETKLAGEGKFRAVGAPM